MAIPALLLSPITKYAAIGVAAVALAGWAMLERNGKLSAQIELERQRSALVQCGERIAESNREIARWRSLEARARAQAAQARRKAEESSRATRAEREALAALTSKPTPAGAGCEEAWGMIEGIRR